MGDRGPALVPVSAERENGTAKQWTAKVKEFALDNEADMAGITIVDPIWVYEGYEVAEPRLVVLGLAQDYENMKHAPPGPGNQHSNTEVRRQYNRGAVQRVSLQTSFAGSGTPPRPNLARWPTP